MQSTLNHRPLRRHAVRLLAGLTIAVAAGGLPACQLQTTIEDFELPGTEDGAVPPGTILTSDYCRFCHSDYDVDNDPHATWSGSLMAHAGRDPLFLAQMATANQDVRNVGYYCMRCHVPMTWITGHAVPADGSALDATDFDGVNCHFCHSMVDPIYKPGVSPPEDEAILQSLASKPDHYGNAMFVIDPTGTRRGPLPDAEAYHDWLYSPFHTTGEFCGTCHDVGNVATTRQADGTWRYNALDTAPDDPDPLAQFPLERTYTEWKLSQFAAGGVDLGGRFGGHDSAIVSTCQDCHMPRVELANACFDASPREGLRRHDFAGAAAPSLDLIAELYKDDPSVDLAAIARGRAKAVSMLERAASLDLRTEGRNLVVRVVNHTGHKLPTGHIEGRRVWVNVTFYDPNGGVVHEHGHYDMASATLVETTTAVYEMRVGLSDSAASQTGYKAGPTGHMAIADTILKDNRIPPMGFETAAFAEAGAPVVAWRYADGQHWDERAFRIPDGSIRAEVRVYYQSTPREYIEHLRIGNQTNLWGEKLEDAWEATGRGAPIEMAEAEITYPPNPCTELAPASSSASGTVLVSTAAGTSTLRIETAAFTIPSELAIDPSGQAVVFTVSDPAGVLWQAELPAGSFLPDGEGSFELASGVGAVESARIASQPETGETSSRVRGAGELRPLQPGAGSVVLQIGDVCLVGAATLCEAPEDAVACP